MFRRYTGGYGSRVTPGIKKLLIINLAVFFIMSIIPVIGDIFYNFFALIPSVTVGSFQIWRIVTYMFLHGNFWHVLLNMFVLWMFGTQLERIWGEKEFLYFFFLTGIFAGISSVLVNFGSHIAIVGASGAVFGVLMASALFFPEQEIYLYFLIPIKMKYFAVAIGVIEFLQGMGQNDGIAHFAHLGGMVAGYLYLRSKYKNSLPSIFEIFKKKRY